MEKPTPKPKSKPNKRKTIQITYPAPYSLSWNPDVQPLLMKNKVGSTNLFQRSKKPRVTPRAYSQEFPSDRPDRAPAHLKYGVFRNRNGATSKQITYPAPYSLSWNPDVQPLLMKNKVGSTKPFQKLDMHPKINRLQRLPSPPKRNRPAGQVPKLPQGLISRSSSIAPMKPVRNVSVHPECPRKIVFRTSNKSYAKELTFSRVSHMDIKPKISAPLSPSFCPTPAFRSLCRKSTLTPTKYRSKEFVQ